MGYSGYVMALDVLRLELTILCSHWLDRGRYESLFYMDYGIPN